MSSAKAMLMALPPIRSQEEPTYYESKRKELFDICQNGNVDELRNLINTLSKAIDIEKLLNEPFERYQWTPLMMAVYKGHINIVSYLINNEATLKSHRYKINIYWQSSSGTTAIDLINRKHKDANEIENIILKEDLRRKRIDSKPTKQGFHETSIESFNLIMNDYNDKRFPIIGGDGGYFGGGIYFAENEEESDSKAHKHGAGFECKLKMGNVLKIDSVDKLKEFYKKYCYTGQYKEYDIDEQKAEWIDPYETPSDVMHHRLLEQGYDSVWGHQNEAIEDVSERILRGGDEFVVYSADQVILEKAFIVHSYDGIWYTLIDFKNTSKLTFGIENILTRLSLKAYNEIFENKNILSIAFDPNISQLAYIYKNGNKAYLSFQDISDRSIRGNRTIAITKPQYIDSLKTLFSASIFSPKGDVLSMLINDSIQINFVPSDNKTPKIIYNNNRILSIAFSQDNDYLFSIGENNTFLIYKIDKEEEKYYYPVYKKLDIKGTHLLTSPTEPKLIIYEGDDTRNINIYTYELQNTLFKKIYTYTSNEPIHTFLFTPDGKYLVFAGVDTDIYILNIANGKIKTTLPLGKKHITSMAISPNGYYLVAGFNDGRLLIWDIHSMDSILLITLTTPAYSKEGIKYICFTKDSLEMAVITHIRIQSDNKTFLQLFDMTHYKPKK
jgi:WD40 repeat protein